MVLRFYEYLAFSQKLFQTDFDIGKRHQLPIVDVIDDEGKIRFRVLDEGKTDHRIDTDHESLNTTGEKFQVIMVLF